MRREDYDGARSRCEALITNRQYSPRAHYNLACILSRLAATATDAKLKEALLDSAQLSLADAVKYGIFKFIRTATLEAFRSPGSAAAYILADRDLQPLLNSRPSLGAAIEDEKRIRAAGYGGSGGGGCIECSMPIDLPGGRTIPLSQLEEGEQLLSWDETSQSQTYGRVSRVRQFTVFELIVINGALRVTPLHPVLTTDGWQRAGDLKEGTMLIRADGSHEHVLSRRCARGEFVVSDLTVLPYKNLCARGFVVHNDKL